MSRLVRAAPFLAAIVACGGNADEQPMNEEPARAAEITSPADGAVVAGPDVRVMLDAHNIDIVPAGVEQPNSGHHHLFLNTDLTPEDEAVPAGGGIVHLGAAQTEYLFEGLTAGEYVIIARLADWQHVPLAGVATDTVRVTVETEN